MSAKTREAYAKYIAPPFHVREAQSDVMLLWELDAKAFEIVAQFTRALIEHIEEEAE